MSLDDVPDEHKTVLEILVRTSKQTQSILPESQPSRVATVPAMRSTIVQDPHTLLIVVKKPKSSIYEKVTRMSTRRQ
jgi:hypothetical protein